MLKAKFAAAAAALAVSATLFAAPASASNIKSLEGIESQQMSIGELQEVTGELNAYDIAAELTALSTKYATTAPKLSAYFASLAAKTLANAEKINAAFKKLGVYTPPK
jgi:hypothetical protein